MDMSAQEHRNMSTRRITCASMATTDGTITHYAIYRANLHYNLAGREPYIDLNRNAQHIATVTKDSVKRTVRGTTTKSVNAIWKWPNHSQPQRRPHSLLQTVFSATVQIRNVAA